MDSLEVRPLPGSETGDTAPPPFWSPDGRFVAFDAGGKLKKVDITGGLPQTLCDLPRGSVAVGGSWNRDGDIIFGNFGGLLHVRETGGAAAPITTLDPSRKEEFHLLPTFLPDGRHFVYLRVSPSAPEAGGTYIGTLDAKPEAQSAQRLMPYAVGVTYAASVDSGPGRLLFLREGTLMAQPFDAVRLALAGEPVPVAERVGSFRDGAYFSASANDVLVYRNVDTDSQLTWYDRQGAVSGRASEPGGFRGVALSPDGARAVASRTNPVDTTKADLWLFDFSRGSAATRLTLGTGLAEFPVWSRDGKRIVFTFNNSSLREALASGEGDEEELLRSESSGGLWANSWSPDGRDPSIRQVRRIRPGPGQYRSRGNSERRSQAGAVPARRPQIQREPGPVFTEWTMGCVRLERVRPERSLRPRVCDGLQQRVGERRRQCAGLPRRRHRTPLARGWPRDLLSRTGRKNDGRCGGAGQEFHVGTPTALFQTPAGHDRRRRDADGKRFLLIAPVGPSASVPFTVVLNWTAGLKK